jgi:hypothetical protein
MMRALESVLSCRGKLNTTDENVPDVPESCREGEAEEQPRFDQLKPATSDALLFLFRRCHNYIAGTQGPYNEGLQPHEATIGTPERPLQSHLPAGQHQQWK